MTETALYMLHDLNDIPNYPLPGGFQFRLYNREDDHETWAKIATATNEFSSKHNALQRFNHEFSTYPADVKRRIIFLETIDGQTIGTATAWFGEWNKETIGRLHWIEIIPEFQGKKLGRPLIAEAMKFLSKYHQKAYLKTQASSQAAIHIYCQFGFKPVYNTEAEQATWDHVFEILKKRA
ncbi:GNAT family N-acetyltransferase [Virgibacillus sp. FSP13]